MSFVLKILHLFLIKILANRNRAYIKNIATYIGNIVYLLNLEVVYKLKKNEKKFKNYNAKEVLINFFQFYLEVLFIYNNKRLINDVEFREFEKINQLLKEYKGVIFLGAHYCNWELAGIYFSQFYNFYAIIREHKNSFINELLKSLRKKYKFNMIFLDKNSSLPIEEIKKLKNRENFILALVVDEYNKEGEYINFLERDIKFNNRYIKLLKVLKKPLVVGGIRREEHNFRIYTIDYILPEEFENNKLFNRIIRGIEKFIKEDINQWILLEGR